MGHTPQPLYQKIEASLDIMGTVTYAVGGTNEIIYKISIVMLQLHLKLSTVILVKL